MLTYSRFVPRTAPALSLVDTVDHVRAHLSSIADPDDDFDEFGSDVRIEYEESDAGTLIVGHLDADADAPYLREGFDPDADDEYDFQPWQGETE